MKTKGNILLGAIKYKKIVYGIVFVLICIGIWGLYVMNKDEFPTFEIKQGLIVGVMPGATPEEVEQQMTIPLENALFSFSEINREATHSYSKNGICYIYTDLLSPVDKKSEVWSKIKLRLNAEKQLLPPNVIAVAVMDNFSSVSALLISLESKDKGYSEMLDYATELTSELNKIPELASTTIIGEQTEEIAVMLDFNKLSAYGINISSLMMNFQTAGFISPGGSFKMDDFNSPIFVNSNVSSEYEIANHIVYSDISGNVVRLKDIADIERRYKEPSSIVRYNGDATIVISVEMRQDNNIVAFGKEVDKVISSFEEGLPDGVEIHRITDQPKVVDRSVWSFLRDLLISMIVVICVMLMLFPLNSALIASSGVPVCTIVAIAIMYVVGIDLNTVTLAALIVVLGMIVDDSIITMDGYMEHLGRGMSRTDAAVASAKELFVPMFMATTAISAMFFPIKGIISGYLGYFVKFFPWVIAISLAMSLIYAVLVVPSLEVKFIASGRTSTKSKFGRLQNKFFDALQKYYEKLQSICFNYPKITLLGGIFAVILGVLMFLQLNIQMMPMAARDFFAVEVNLDANSNLNNTISVVDTLEKKLLDDTRVKSVTSFVGSGAPRFNATYAPLIPAKNSAQLIVNTKSLKATESLLIDCQNNYSNLFPEASLRFKQMDYQGVTAPISIEVRGNSQSEIKPIADSIKAFMLSIPTLQWVHTDCDNFISGINIDIKPDESAKLGINKSMLSMYTAAAMNGVTATNLWDDKKKIPVNIYNSAVNDSVNYDMIKNIMVPTIYPNVSVPLRQVADISPVVMTENLSRKAGVEQIAVFADLKYGQSHPAIMKQIANYIDENIKPNAPDGVEIKYAGLSETNKVVIPEILLSFICAVAVLFLFLLFHFKKVSLSILTLVLSMLCFFGAFLGLWLFDLDFGLTSVLGLISLVGIIVRNGIIMFEYAEELRSEKGMSVKEAAMEAGKRRMRPIFLTSCTTALGVMPMIISADALWLPMGVVICFGTMFSILLIVLIMPISYWQIYRLTEKKHTL